jgi:uncharacterized SAM-binding protein YcdF (DUF218 family)
MRRRLFLVFLAFILLLGIVFIFSSSIYDFLAVPSYRVDADIIVVEGWVPAYVIEAAAVEFKKGGYREIVTSDLELEQPGKTGSVNSVDTEAAVRLAQMGIAPSQIVVCQTLRTDWNKTAQSARIARETLESRGIHPKGINVFTIGVHSRRSWLAYQHAFGSKIPVGIFQIPETGLDPARWWASGLGIKRVTKGYVAWIRERLFGASP